MYFLCEMLKCFCFGYVVVILLIDDYIIYKKLKIKKIVKFKASLLSAANCSL